MLNTRLYGEIVVAVAAPSATRSVRRSKLMLGSRIAPRHGLQRDTCVQNPGGDQSSQP